MFTSTGKKQRIAGDRHFECGLSTPNQAFVIGANAMIGTALAAIAYGISASPTRRKRANTSATTIAAPEPITNPPSASLNVNQPALTEHVAVVPERLRDRRRPRQQELAGERGEAPTARRRSRRRRRRAPAASSPGRVPLHASPSGASFSKTWSAPPRASDSRSLRHELEEARVLARLGRPRLRQVDLDDLRDPAGPRRHHDDARREEHRLGDRVRDEDDRRAGLLPDAEQLHVQALAGHLVERAERLVHQQQRRRERERARDRDALLHAARELPRVVVLEPGELDELEHLLDPLGALGAAPAEHLERQRDVLRHGAPVVEHGVLEDDPVVAVEPGLVRRLAVHRHLPARRLDEVADDAQQRRLPAARRADQRDELAGLDRQVDPLERDGLAAARTPS